MLIFLTTEIFKEEIDLLEEEVNNLKAQNYDPVELDISKKVSLLLIGFVLILATVADMKLIYLFFWKSNYVAGAITFAAFAIAQYLNIKNNKK